ncbi:hypothetical protein K1T71_015208 [Dendrolimus kikuchii]|nr:hypothetical protein K1T71_015208 [Dendrolimus kikuchii]
MLVPGSRSRFWDRSQSSGADSDGTSGASSPARARSPLRPTGGAPAASTSILAGAEAYLRTEGGEKGRKARKATAAKVAAASQCAALVGNISALGPGELRLAACAQVAEIIQIAQTSGNLKGVYVRRLKEAASRVSDIVDTLVTRNPESEAWKLGNENARLRMELSSLREENRSYRREFEDMRKALKASASVAEPAPAVMAAPTPVPVKRKAQAATAEAAAVPEPPAAPAAVKKSRPARAATNRGGVKWRLKMQRRAARDAAVALTAPATAPVPVVSAPRPAPRQRTAPAAATSVVAAPAVPARIPPAAPPPPPVPPPPAPEGGAWTTVVKRKKGKGARADGPPPPTQAQAAPLPSGRGQQQRKQAAKPAVVFREPKSAAVIIKLLPAAAAKGVGYREVFAKASTVVDIAAMGLREGLKVVRTVRDARLLEFQPGPESAAKADRVAEALRGALAGMAEVVRPVKRGELYVSGLDESVTVDGLRDAIARAGKCRRDDVRTKHIGAGPGGLGASYVMCPVAAAKVIVEMGYLVVGFTSARVEALEARPIRCYRCYNVGHGAQTCPDTCPDRTNLCLRCGKSGHKMPDCTARNPHCAACAAGGLNAAHPTGLADFEGWIEEVGTVVARSRPRPLLVLGDFNAKSVAWGSPSTCARGESLEEWAIEQGLVVLNRGAAHTCVRQQGGSIVDITFASPELARRVRDWRVVTGVETLSDHRYIRFSVSTQHPDPPSREPPVGDCPRWALQKLNREAFKEALIDATWASEPEVDPPDLNIEQEAEILRSLVTGVCDAAMPRRGRFRPSRKVYWWNPVLEGLRRACNSAHRQYTRHRRRRRRAADAAAVEAQLYEGYRSARETLRFAIRDAKNTAWGELLDSINEDPWGRPFKMVRNKLRAWAPPLTESLPRDVVCDVVGALFP